MEEEGEEDGEGEEGEGEREHNTPSLSVPIVKHPAITKVTRVARATKKPMVSSSIVTGPDDLEE